MEAFDGAARVFRNVWHVLAVLALILLWAAVFLVGSVVDSKWLGDLAVAETNAFWRVGEYVGYFAAWGWSNIIILMVISSVAGDIAADHQPRPGSRRSRFLRVLARGFFIFLVLVTGQILATGTVEGQGADLRQAQYFRFATFGSLCSFIVGYNPGLMNGIVQRLSKGLTGAEGAGDGAGAVEGAAREKVATGGNGTGAERDACADPIRVDELQVPGGRTGT